ncbi:hypothetical protein JKP88DRAFT_157641, partial [Tribonema minus]
MVNVAQLQAATGAQSRYVAGLIPGSVQYLYIRARNTGTGEYTVLNATGAEVVTAAARPVNERAYLTASDFSDTSIVASYLGPVAVSGSYAILGAYGKDSLGISNAGGAYAFELNATTGAWEEKAVLETQGFASDAAGKAVAISGTYAAAGAPSRLAGGIAYVYERNAGTSAWQQKAVLRASDTLPGDSFGASIAMTGTYCFVGASNRWSRGTASGGVYVFQRNAGSGAWEEVAIVTASDETASCQFGEAVAADGTYLIVGSSGKGTLGSAYVFERDASTGVWTEKAVLVPSDSVANSNTFGESVALKGSVAVVGAPSRTGSSGVYVYERSAGGAWQSKAVVTGVSGVFTGRLGGSVAIDGDYLLAGADTTATQQGVACIYKRNTTSGVWEDKGWLTASDAAISDKLGSYVALSGQTAFVSSPFHSVAGVLNAGRTVVYDLPSLSASPPGTASLSLSNNVGTGQYTCLTATGTQLITASSPSSGYALPELFEDSAGAHGDKYGGSVAASGSCVAIGAHAKDRNGNGFSVAAGGAYVFERDGAGAWTQKTKLFASDGLAGDLFGCSVGVSGRYAVVGAYNKAQGGKAQCGCAYVFERDTGTGAWSQKAALYPPQFETAMQFGYSVSIRGGVIAVGAPGKKCGEATLVGATYVFTRNSTSQAWEYVTAVTAPAGGTSDSFGKATTWTSAGELLVGASTAGPGALQKGKAYAFAPCSPAPPSSVTLSQETVLTPGDCLTGDAFGGRAAFGSVALAVDGERIAVGAYLRDAGPVSGSNSGAVYVFEKAAGTWQQTVLPNPDAASNANLGYAVAMQGDWVFGSAPGSSSSTGSVLIWKEDAAAGTWSRVQVLTRAGAAAFDTFGKALAVCGDVLAVGAYWATSKGCIRAGAVVVFERNV